MDAQVARRTLLAIRQRRSLNATTGTWITTPPGGLVAPIIVPIGSVLKEITFAYLSTAAGLNLGLWKTGLTTGADLTAPKIRGGVNPAHVVIEIVGTLL
jgi:hypothetical protein